MDIEERTLTNRGDPEGGKKCVIARRNLNPQTLLHSSIPSYSKNSKLSLWSVLMVLGWQCGHGGEATGQQRRPTGGQEVCHRQEAWPEGRGAGEGGGRRQEVCHSQEEPEPPNCTFKHSELLKKPSKLSLWSMLMVLGWQYGH